MTNTTLKIGDKLYCYLRGNRNRQGHNGKPAPLWREETIIAESPTHWHVGPEYDRRKVRKTTLFEAGKQGWSGSQWFTDAGRVDCEWLDQHAGGIARHVEFCKDVEQLRAIAKIIGYKEK